MDISDYEFDLILVLNCYYCSSFTAFQGKDLYKFDISMKCFC